jgi:hypothetical protein
MKDRITFTGKAAQEMFDALVPGKPPLSPAPGYAVGGDFYNGIEWLACWLLDNVEGEMISEEQLRPWAAKAWEAHLKRPNH